MPAEAGIQYTAAPAINTQTLWDTGSPPSRGRRPTSINFTVTPLARVVRGGRDAPSRTRRAGNYLSGDNGICTSPVMNLVGPAADGMMSKSKISVGSHSVAQAFGISTTPEMWPWHGAVPRIE